MNIEIEKYINKRYKSWHDYSNYHCALAGIPEESIDVLNEVLLSLLQKKESQLLDLIHSKKDKYTELDFYVLRMIKFNATSDTAPYRFKYREVPIERNIDYQRIEIMDESGEQYDKAESILNQLNNIRTIVESLSLDKKAYEVFEFKFFQDSDFKDWNGTETLKELYAIYSNVRSLIKKKYNGEIIF